MDQTPASVTCVALRTPTLPPATHTNTWLVGRGDITIIDPASPWEDEQQRLLSAVLDRVRRGERVERIVLTHHHGDHVGGAVALRAALAARGHTVPLVGHALNRGWLDPSIPLDETWADGETLICGDVSLRAWHTPGHAPGHLVLEEPDSGVAVVGDLVAGIGTIAIGPHDGHLGQYLQSLERIRARGLRALLPAHGPTLTQPDVVLSFYVAHRHQRSAQIREALHRRGASQPDELVPVVYPELPSLAWPLAAGQILSHLRWLASEGLAMAEEDGVTWRAA